MWTAIRIVLSIPLVNKVTNWNDGHWSEFGNSYDTAFSKSLIFDQLGKHNATTLESIRERRTVKARCLHLWSVSWCPGVLPLVCSVSTDLHRANQEVLLCLIDPFPPDSQFVYVWGRYSYPGTFPNRGIAQAYRSSSGLPATARQRSRSLDRPEWPVCG